VFTQRICAQGAAVHMMVLKLKDEHGWMTTLHKQPNLLIVIAFGSSVTRKSEEQSSER